MLSAAGVVADETVQQRALQHARSALPCRPHLTVPRLRTLTCCLVFRRQSGWGVTVCSRLHSQQPRRCRQRPQPQPPRCPWQERRLLRTQGCRRLLQGRRRLARQHPQSAGRQVRHSSCSWLQGSHNAPQSKLPPYYQPCQVCAGHFTNRIQSTRCAAAALQHLSAC